MPYQTERIPYVKLSETAHVPVLVRKGDSGMSLYANEEITLPSQTPRIISTGIAAKCPEGTEFQIRTRSGLAATLGVWVFNAPGTIDSNYTGELKVILCNIKRRAIVIKPKMAIAQIVLAPVIQMDWYEVDSLEDTNRGAAGFGSSGVFHDEQIKFV